MENSIIKKREMYFDSLIKKEWKKEVRNASEAYFRADKISNIEKLRNRNAQY